MTDKIDKKRRDPISVRIPDERYDEFLARVEQSGLSRNGYVVQRVLGEEPARASRRPVIEQKLVAHLLSQIIVLHGDLQDIARLAKEGRNIEALLVQASHELTAIRSACFKAMGRKP